jgi:hypothetical protein
LLEALGPAALAGAAFLYDPAAITGREELGTRSDIPLWGDAYTGGFDLPKAAVFDVDGTLLDSVDLHAIAWHEAMVKFGHDVSFEQARSQIAKGGDKLIPTFLNAAERKDHGEELEKWCSERFKSRFLPLIRPFSRGTRLVAGGARRRAPNRHRVLGEEGRT